MKFPVFSLMIREFDTESGSQETASSTLQSPWFQTPQRIAQNRRVCVRFSIARGPGERLGRRKSAESAKTYPGAILLGPRILALYSPGGKTHAVTAVLVQRITSDYLLGEEPWLRGARTQA